MHALIIEDEALITLMIEDLLLDLGFGTFDIAVTEAEAVMAAAEHRPDLITSDVHLLVGSGIDAVHTICFNCAIPIVFVTANAGQVRERRPAAVVVDKPIQVAAFRQSVGTALNQMSNSIGGKPAACDAFAERSH